jgi:putative Mn2+ efflux pump MntP
MNILHMTGAAFLLSAAISLDAAATGFAYGMNNTRVPWPHILVISFICSLLLGVSLFIGFYLSRIMSPSVALWLSFGILAAIGLLKIAGYIKNKLKREERKPRKITWAETLILALTLALDGMAVGLGAAMARVDILFCVAAIGFSFIIGALLFRMGQGFGVKVAKKTNLDLSWLGGGVLICLACLKFV